MTNLVERLRTTGMYDLSDEEVADAADTIERQAAQIEVMREALDELVDIVQAIRAEEYKPDSFTCQPALAALSITPDDALRSVKERAREQCAKAAEDFYKTSTQLAESRCYFGYPDFPVDGALCTAANDRMKGYGK